MATPSLPQPPPGKIERIWTWQVTLNNTVENLPYRLQIADVIYINTTLKNPARNGNIDAYNFVWASGSPTPNPGGMPYLLQPESIGTNDPRIGSSAHVEVYMAVYRGLARWDRQDWGGQLAYADGAWTGSPLVLQATLPASTITIPTASEVVIIEECSANVVPTKTGPISFNIGPFKTDDATITKIYEFDYPDAPHGEGIPSPLSTRDYVWERRPSLTSVPTNRIYSSPCQWISGDYTYNYNWGSSVSAYRRVIKTSLKSTIARPALNVLKSYGYVNRLTSPVKPPMRSVVSHGAVPALKTPGTDRTPLTTLISRGAPQALSSPYRPNVAALVSLAQVPSLQIALVPHTPPLNELVSVGALGHLQVGAVKVPLTPLVSFGEVLPLERTDLVMADQFIPGGVARIPIGGDTRPRP